MPAKTATSYLLRMLMFGGIILFSSLITPQKRLPGRPAARAASPVLSLSVGDEFPLLEFCALDAASPLSRSDSAPDALKKPSLLCGCRFAQLDRLPWDSDRVGAVVAFIESDERCDAELRALARVADAVAGLSVEVVAVRSPRGASPASSGEFGKVRFVDDPNSLAKRSLDLPASPVCSFVLGTGGRVQSICSDASDPLAHALARLAMLGS